MALLQGPSLATCKELTSARGSQIYRQTEACFVVLVKENAQLWAEALETVRGGIVQLLRGLTWFVLAGLRCR